MTASSGPVHCTSGSESPTVRMTVHVREKGCPTVGVSGGEIVALGGLREGSKGWKE